MTISPSLLQKYARLIVRTGANVQPGQVVQLTVSVEQHDFAALIIEECYQAGAKKVNVEWQYDKKAKLDICTRIVKHSEPFFHGRKKNSSSK